jgi:trans-aconitate 2-methyltransferase
MPESAASGNPQHGPREWDAETYDAVADPQFSWGVEVLERLQLEGDETVLDAGCGTGRVTAELVKRLPRGRVIAVDASRAMIARAQERLGEGVEYLTVDLSELELTEPVDLIFSTATLHWVLDHDRLFACLRQALREGGHLVAQCGGDGNVAEHARAIAVVAARPEYAAELDGVAGVWNFATPEETEERLRRAGFSEASCWLEPKPVQPPQPLEFTSTVTMGPLLARLPEEKRRPFAEAVLAESPSPLVLEYVRLNIEARL